MNDAASQTRNLTRALRRAADVNFDIRVADLAQLSGYSPGHFQRIFRRHFGISPGRFLRHERIDRFAGLLREGRSVTDAALEAGFESSSRAFDAARDGLGMSPSQLARGGDGERVQFGTSTCRLGTVLVAATARGLCAVLIGNDAKTLEVDLGKRLPRAALSRADASFRQTVEQVVHLIDHSEETPIDLPLDLRGTVFQRKVWHALQDIPPGRTMTYGELAQRVGLPGGARAVARACGANPAAVVVPCHRVVAANGGLGGYRWGIDRKRALLEREGADA